MQKLSGLMGARSGAGVAGGAGLGAKAGSQGAGGFDPSQLAGLLGDGGGKQLAGLLGAAGLDPSQLSKMMGEGGAKQISDLLEKQGMGGLAGMMNRGPDASGVADSMMDKLMSSHGSPSLEKLEVVESPEAIAKKAAQPKGRVVNVEEEMKKTAGRPDASNASEGARQVVDFDALPQSR